MPDWKGLDSSGEKLTITEATIKKYMMAFPGQKKWLHFRFMEIPKESKFFGGRLLRGARVVVEGPGESYAQAAYRAGWFDVATVLDPSFMPPESAQEPAAVSSPDSP